MYSVDYEKLSGEIDPAFFQQFLQENGWTPFKTKREDVSVFQYIQDDQFEQIEIPLDRALSDYNSALYRAVKTVANVEGKNIDQTLRILLKPNLEKMEFRISDILKDTWKQERDRGRVEGRLDERIENIYNLTETMSWTPEQAMAALKVPENERRQYKSWLKLEAFRKRASAAHT